MFCQHRPCRRIPIQLSFPAPHRPPVSKPCLNSMRPSVHPEQSAPTARQTDLRLDLVALTLLAVFVSLVYGARLTVQPLVGEETRWATGAREMLATGDWIVPRQQGHVFAE